LNIYAVSLWNVKISEVLIKKFAIIGANGVILPDIKIGEGGAVVQYGMTRDDLYLIFENVVF
jgi:acetyltransferase-like isoleucine patch superfamily enzyme